MRQLSSATMFSKLDANSRFWQVPLAPESRLLTTCHLGASELPFSAPELFHCRMNQILEDDELIFGSDKA